MMNDFWELFRLNKLRQIQKTHKDMMDDLIDRGARKNHMSRINTNLESLDKVIRQHTDD